MTVTVEITRNKQTRVLAARIVQRAADGLHRGRDLLRNRGICRIPAAQERVTEFFRGCDIGLAFDIQASPDVDPPYRVGEDKHAVRRELES